MMRASRLLLVDRRASAAAEMALVLPLLLIIMFGAAELGNYFMNEHTLVKAVRDGARFAARQSFSNYTACAGSPGGSVVADTKNVVMNGYLTGSTGLLTPNISTSDITVTTNCAASAGGQNMLGIYKDRPGGTGAQRVIVTASVTYRPIVAAFGFSGVGFTLNAASQAAVSGL
jgi:hypothetical protein